MTRLPRVSGKDLVRALQRADFSFSHVRGSHHYLKTPSKNLLVIIPVHRNQTLKPETLKSILRQAGLSIDDLIRLLRE